MDIFQFVIVMLHITYIVTKSRKTKYDTSSADETIENLLYFKDCQKKPKEQTTTTIAKEIAPLKLSLPTTPAPPQSNCPFPKMCCSLTCGNECDGNRGSSFIGRQMETIQNFPQDKFQNFPPQNIPDMQSITQLNPPVQPQIRKRKKFKLPANQMKPSVDGRRNFGFAKAKIKSLISQDDDIRKILKDLVRVTMQKVDLLEMVKDSQRSGYELVGGKTVNDPSVHVDEGYDEYDE